MGSHLTLAIANCYMFFYEQQTVKQIHNSLGLYFRYIDGILKVYQKYRYSYYIEILGACKEILSICRCSTKSALHVSIMEILITGYFHIKHFG